MWFLFAAIFVAAMMALTRRQWNPQGDTIDVARMTRNLAKFFTIGIVVAFALTFVGDTVVVVPAGHRAVVFDRFKGLQTTPLKEGMNFIVPMLQEATLVDVRVQKAEFDSTAASKDLQSVHTKVALNFLALPDQVAEIYRNYGLGVTEKVIHPAVQEALKAATARYTAEELITRREEVKQQIHQILEKHMATANLKLVETYITDFEFSTEFARAIESKQIAEQQALKARRDLDRIKIEAEQKLAGARAEAEGLKLQKEAITPALLELRKIDAQRLAIEKWDGRMPTTMLGGGSTPLLNLGAITGK
jgi:regulator of protease activity HflC (stomatin/prohibitin superfamily)